MPYTELSEPSNTSTNDRDLSAFLSARPRLFAIAYRMLRSAAAAEDLVQDVWVRWQTADRTMVRDAMAFLATTTTRLALNSLQSARSQRETSFGAGVPESIDGSTDPAVHAERDEAIDRALMILLERLSAPERAAFILREAFDYSYRDIASVLRLEEANARQVVTRARQRIAGGYGVPASANCHRRLRTVFAAASQLGDVALLEHVLAGDVFASSTLGRRTPLAA